MYMPTQQHILADIVAQLGVQALPQDERERIVNALAEDMIERIVFVAMGKLPEADFDRIDALMQAGKGAEAQADIAKSIPGFDALATQIVRDGIAEYKQLFAADASVVATDVPTAPASPYTFTQAVPTVWTAVENVLREAGITHKGLLNFVTDLVEDYTQDGSIPETRQTSYHRDFGAGLLAHMTGQQNVTQASIKNPINTAPLFASEPIFKSMKDRIDNSFLTAQQQSEVKELLKKIHDVAKTLTQ
jgi:hypothetical protein